eukprot:1903267-Prymnesium_polylepis.1
MSQLRVSAVARIFLKRFSRPPGLCLREMHAVLYASMNCCTAIERLVRGFLMTVPSAAVVRRFGGVATVRTAPMLAKHSAVWRRIKSSIILSLVPSLAGSMRPTLLSAARPRVRVRVERWTTKGRRHA